MFYAVNVAHSLMKSPSQYILTFNMQWRQQIQSRK